MTPYLYPGESVGKIWIDAVKAGYNAFLSADPESGSAPSPGMPPFATAADATNDVVNNDGTGRLYDELVHTLDPQFILDARHVALIGYSHGGGIIDNISDDLRMDPNVGIFADVVFAGTIDAIQYGRGADSKSTQDGQYVTIPLSTSPAVDWGNTGVNYFESQGYKILGGIPTEDVHVTMHGVTMPGVINTFIPLDDHSQIANDMQALLGVETAMIDALAELS